LLQAAAAAAAAGGPPPAPKKSVVFSQFLGMLDLVGAALAAEGIPFVRLDGKTTAANRTAAIRAFAGKLPLVCVTHITSCVLLCEQRVHNSLDPLLKTDELNAAAPASEAGRVQIAGCKTSAVWPAGSSHVRV
jgi:hypothetical protein